MVLASIPEITHQIEAMGRAAVLSYGRFHDHRSQ
jgi:hypothetical protein